MTVEDKAYMDSILFNHLKRNCFDTLPFGASIYGIYVGTPVEILHSILLGLCIALSSFLWIQNLLKPFKRLFGLKDTLGNPGNTFRLQNDLLRNMNGFDGTIIIN